MDDSTPGTITIPLTQGQVTVIDAIDADLAQFKWCAQFDPSYANGGKFVAIRAIPRGKRKQTVVRLHRVILARMLRRPLLRSEDVDHEDRNPLNNRQNNLRLATRSQNGANKNVQSNSSSGLKGASWDKKARKWRAQLQFNGKGIHLGYFDTVEEAHTAYCEGAIKYHGEFANSGQKADGLEG